MRVLVACEESQAVYKAFRELGHEAYSCDIQECSGGHPEWHIQGDVLPLLKEKWDLIIAHPPCTYLSKAGGNRLRINGEIQKERFEKGICARNFFMEFYNADFSEELHRVIIHGVLHLLKEDDTTPSLQQRMRAAEEKALALLADMKCREAK